MLPIIDLESFQPFPTRESRLCRYTGSLSEIPRSEIEFSSKDVETWTALNIIRRDTIAIYVVLAYPFLVYYDSRPTLLT